MVDKPAGLSSAAVVGRLKRALREGGHGQPKIGHGGTLDPLATGVLPVAVGEATKLAGRLLGGDKAYAFTLALGEERDTDDAQGEVTAVSDVRPDAAALAAVLPRFRGTIRQRPPAFSALKLGGERAYRLARAGAAPVLAEREVVIRELELEEAGPDRAVLRVVCSKGTYVRSLARDIARAAGTVGHVAALRRTRAGPFGIERAVALDKLARLMQGPAPEQALEPLTAGLDDIPALAVDPHEADALRKGQRLRGARSATIGLHLATLGPVPVALVDVSPDDAGALVVRVVRGFNL